MPKITLTKENLMQMFLQQDLEFQTAAVLKILDALPTTYADILIRKLYYTKVTDEPYYLLRKEDWLEFYGTREECTKYILNEYPLIDKNRISRLFNEKIPTLNGFTIQLFSNKNV